MDTNPVIRHALGVPSVLIASRASNLPAPVEIAIDDELVTLDFDAREDLDSWAEWVDAEVALINKHGDIEHSEAVGEKFELPMVLRYISIAAVVAS